MKRPIPKYHILLAIDSLIDRGSEKVTIDLGEKIFGARS
jgi:hypothetical protein